MATHSYCDTAKQRGMSPFPWMQFPRASHESMFRIIVTTLASHTLSRVRALMVFGVGLRVNTTDFPRSSMVRWTSLVVGGLTFLAAHAVEVVMWKSWFGDAWEPFFTNAGEAVAFTTGCVLVAGLLAALSAKKRRDIWIHAGNVTGGAAVVMTLVVFWRGPGRLFPIAIVFGIWILGISSYLGAFLAWPFKQRITDPAMGRHDDVRASK